MHCACSAKSVGYMLAVTFLAGTLGAEPPVGSRLGKRYDPHITASRHYSIVGAHGYARCIADKRTDATRRYLMATDVQQKERLGALLFREVGCIGVIGMAASSTEQDVQISPAILRGMLAEALIRRSHGQTKLMPVAMAKAYQAPWNAISQRPESVDEMAVCVADTNPQAVSFLMNTSPDSPDEEAALSSLMPSLGPCLVQGAQLHADPQSLRAALAEALYHRMANDFAPSLAAAGKN